MLQLNSTYKRDDMLHFIGRNGHSSFEYNVFEIHHSDGNGVKSHANACRTVSKRYSCPYLHHESM